jgi:hypothetical protein
VTPGKILLTHRGDNGREAAVSVTPECLARAGDRAAMEPAHV